MVEYKRVNKPTARKMYNSGYSIQLLPCKVNSFMVFDKNYKGFIIPVLISSETSSHSENKFDRTVNDFEYYNCNSQMGYYAHYYVSNEDFNKYNELGGKNNGIEKENN